MYSVLQYSAEPVTQPPDLSYLVLGTQFFMAYFWGIHLAIDWFCIHFNDVYKQMDEKHRV